MPLSLANSAIAIIAPTHAAVAIARRLRAGLANATIWTKDSSPETYSANSESANSEVTEDKLNAGSDSSSRRDNGAGELSPNLERDVRLYSGPLATLFQTLWASADALICILATGAIVRLIAPLLEDKHSDPAVVAIDENGQFAISLCGGHVAGGDELANIVSTLLDTTPVISSGATAYQLPAIDTLGEPMGWQRGAGNWTDVASAIVRTAGNKISDARAAGSKAEDVGFSQSVAVIQTCGWDIWRDRLPPVHPFLVWDRCSDSQPSPAATLWISDRQPPTNLPRPYACWHPRTLWIGVGCERGTSATTIETAIRTCLQQHNLAWEAIAGLTSIDIKRDEIGLVELAERYQWPIVWHRADALKTVSVPNPSSIVEHAVGTPSVAEAAALLAASTTTLIAEKRSSRVDGAACTVAIARAAREYSDRCGALHLVGMGPGSLSLIAPAARAAIAKADVVVGYQLYLDLIAPLLTPQQIVRASPITQEVQRAKTAIELANRGLSVAVISSGDCGIYGMAGLVMEQLACAGWDGITPTVEVIPGITALQAAAARVGAPLMHDFCAISLSDLLTPWETIEQRLEAAATADFVVALYNPRSRTRTQGLATAREIFSRHRSPDTPVAIVKSAFRPSETTVVTTLQHFDVTQVDMLSTVLIGNSKTFIHANHPITPRGYSTTYSSPL
ncbi:MAG: precorrin-3B C(17)-methyltransferase [Synechococcus sp.]